MKNPKPWLGSPTPTADETREWREITHPSVMRTLARYRDDLPPCAPALFGLVIGVKRRKSP